MEEAKEKEIIEIIRAMNATGMTQSEIRENLRMMGLEEGEIAGILEKAQTKPTTREVHEAVKAIQEKIETGEHIKPAMEAIEEHREATGEIKEKVEEISAGLGELHEKHEELKARFATIEEVSSELEGLKKLMLEMKPLLAAIKDLQEKLVETNTEMLMRLKAGKKA